MENERKSKVIIVLLVILIIIVLGLTGYVVYDKFIAKDTPTTGGSTQATTNEATKNDSTTVTVDKDQMLKDVSQVYETVYKSIHTADTYGGKTDEYYKNKYGEYFTEKGLNMLSAMFENHVPVKDIMSSIFNFQNQGMRTLTIVSASTDVVVATGTYNGEGDKTTYPEYIIFKKVDGVWKIDMFE